METRVARTHFHLREFETAVSGSISQVHLIIYVTDYLQARASATHECHSAFRENDQCSSGVVLQRERLLTC